MDKNEDERIERVKENEGRRKKIKGKDLGRFRKVEEWKDRNNRNFRNKRR